MLGAWLNQNSSAAAVGKTIAKFALLKPSLKTRRLKNRTEYFIPASMMSDKMRDYHSDEMTEVDEMSEQVEDILGDVTQPEINFATDELKSAQLENLKARTALINEKLDSRKNELFSEWSERFFEIFSASFSKFKNALIDLHLDEGQLAVLTEKLNDALSSMKDGLITINNEWMNEDVEQKEQQ